MKKLLRALQSLFGDRYAIVETAAYNASEEERANLQRQVARLESDLASNPTEVAKQRALLAVVTKIRESLDLEIIFQSTATEVRQLLDADRVGIYRFDPEVGWSKGLFVSEDVRPPYHSILGFQINDDCFAREHGVYYQRGRMWVVEDFDQIEIQDCHRSVVERLGFKANLVVPLLRGDRLWGLLTLHQCSQPRQWKDSEIEFIRQIALHLGIAVQHAEALRQVQNQSEHLTSAVSKAVEREKTVATAIEKIRRSLDLETIFSRTTQEVRQLLGVDRVAIYRFYPNWSGEFIFESVAEGWNPLVGPSIKTVWEDTHLQETQGGRYRNGETFVVEDIYTADLTDCHQEILEQFQVKAFCVVPVFSGEELWGLLGAYQNDRIRHWEQAEIDLLVQIGNQFGVAVRQAASVVKLRFKSEQLAASVERERAVAAIIDKIRRPLDLDTVFTTTAQEVRQLLKADRVGVFRFNTEQKDEGEFVAEAVSDGWTSAMAQKVYDSCFGERFAPDYAKGRIQAVADINDAGLSDCHVEILAQFQVRANLVVPLLQGTYLWGLLCIHQCQRPRQWQESEVEFAEQIGAQLSIAIQQAEFLSQTAQRKEELQTALTAQLKQRSEELLQEAERERASALVIDKIRQTLDLETIFQTATTEIRQLLNTDRVAVFRFDPGSNWKSGECISEDVAAKFVSAIALKVRDRCFGEKHATYYQKQQVWHVDDVQTAGLRDCHREMLEGFQVRSNLVAPLFKGDILWGLLCIHQCSGPRQWQAVEIEFATKIAANLGVAIQQAGLLAQTQRRSLQLQTTLADLNAIVDNLADGLLVTDVLGRITRFNPALLEMFALDNADLKGQSLAESFPLDLAMLTEKAERQDAEMVAIEVELSHNRVGQALATSIQKDAEGEEGEQCLGSVILIRDVTVEREVDRMKTDFLATVSHELRTPLTSILGFSSIIQDKLNATVFPAVTIRNLRTSKALRTVATNIEIIISEAERLTSLINDVLDISKMEAGRVDWNIETVRPIEVVEQAIAATSSLFEKKELLLIRDFAPDLPEIQGDRDRIVQVIINLLSNAVKFTPQGSVICQATVRDRNLLISICDTGIGINPNDIDKIFERFRQVGDILTDKPQGTGLGLPICKQIIEHHGGTIWVESQLGQGSNFSFSLPLTCSDHAH